MVQNNQELRRKQWATQSSIPSFSSTALEFTSCALLTSFAHSVALIHLLARSLAHSTTPELMEKWANRCWDNWLFWTTVLFFFYRESVILLFFGLLSLLSLMDWGKDGFSNQNTENLSDGVISCQVSSSEAKNKWNDGTERQNSMTTTIDGNDNRWQRQKSMTASFLKIHLVEKAKDWKKVQITNKVIAVKHRFALWHMMGNKM